MLVCARYTLHSLACRPARLQVDQHLVGSVLDWLADELDNHRAVAWALAVEGAHLVLHLCTVVHMRHGRGVSDGDRARRRGTVARREGGKSS